MLYDVKLRIAYAYTSPSDKTRLVVRLLPNTIPGTQDVLSRLLTFDPVPAERRERVDFFGNTMTTAVWHHPMQALTIDLAARFDRKPQPKLLDFSPPVGAIGAEIASRRSLASYAPQHFTAASRRAGPDPSMTAFARDHIGPEMTTFQAIEAIGRALYTEMRFDASATDVGTPAQEAFANRHGVCQDFSHVMISCLRGVGIPAGYVSGFLRTLPPPGQPRLEGADAMHAWVRAWAGNELGWIEYDPTNAQFAGGDYVTVAWGRDYDDVSPVRGAVRAAGGQTSTQAVDVIPIGA
ncbi:transglutaminase family protein [Maritimibacter sp. UBA3975]|uniref:transglutaminase family protein n=1 Tax=Maritimibacter sp. UBA3975 TaxID=1946833 RepID=UPI000C09655E|nr:transglutaminase family protein [Maritimibacter sp. UBA3975]MAM60247.1 transglutaminase [Maritimibacter sp.]|tara:strand:+ start:6591 stop:7472 length:882 start_codon:yes stop_codon:yes gene_type:complete